jgi:Resolvase, N terminal domain
VATQTAASGFACRCWPWLNRSSVSAGKAAPIQASRRLLSSAGDPVPARDRRSARREFDIVAAWSVCRLGRSLPDLIGLLGELRSRDIDLYLHQQALDTSTPSGRMLFGMLGVFSEFERAMIRDRVMAAGSR